MTTGMAMLHKAVNALWDSSGLDWEVKQQWEESVRDDSLSLNDNEGAPAQPIPYVAYTIEGNTVETRMSNETGVGTKINRFEIWEVALIFRVYGIKTVAADLIEKITQVYGGHPVNKPQKMALDHGNVILVQYNGDFSARITDTEVAHTLNYNVKLDIPVAE